MIPIDYTSSTPKFDDFVTDFIKMIDDIIDRGYIGNRVSVKVSKARRMLKKLKGKRRKKFKDAVSADQKGWQKWSAKKEVKVPKKMIEVQTVFFLYFIEELGDRLFKGNTEELEICINLIEDYLPDIKDSQTVLYEDIQNLFVKHGFDQIKFPKDELIEATGTNVCPYCNRVFVHNIGIEGGAVKGQLDHFLPKDKYPYLAVSKYNLIPSCPFCNSSVLKGNKDPRVEHMVSPYALKDSQGLKFTNNIGKKGFLNLVTCAQSVKVSYSCTGNPNLRNNARVFHLMEIYNSHKDYVAEMYYRYIMIKSPFYKVFANKMLNTKACLAPSKISVTHLEWDRIILGVYTNEKDFYKRPMSKFCMDMLEDFKRKGL